MDLESLFLIIGSIILIGFTGRVVRQTTQVPESLFLILFGLILGPLTGLVPTRPLLDFVPIISAAAMIAILVESGIEFEIKRLKGSLGSALLFTLMVAVVTTVLVAAVLHYFFGWEPAHAALLGLISSGTTTITAMSLLKGTDVSKKVQRTVLLETIINDFTLIVGTFLIVEYMKVKDFSINEAAKLFFSELSTGILIGILFAVFWRWVLLEINKKKELSYASTIGICFVIYYLASFFGGNPIIAIFTFSLLLGNYHRIYQHITTSKVREKSKFDPVLRSIKSVQTDFTFFIASSFFVLLGITLDPSLFDFSTTLLIASIIVIIIATRYLASEILAKTDKDFSSYSMIMSLMIPRGYVAAVLAFVPAQEGIEIPRITDIMVVLIVVTTLIAIGGTVLYTRLGKKKAKQESG
ncbi:hypothetical protein GF318_00785 [Candidatus Micrarchaeota archaeon]|nr:hypothetical protein [Candidatus Micrarchaeota archaeon]